MIVCVCHRASDREIVRHAHAGMNFDDIQFEFGMATQCGRRESCARDAVAPCSATRPVAALHDTPAELAIQLAASSTQSKAWASSALSLAV
ncbi:(2Fe-2S)-binding protein [Ramlibacter sp. H39-3-26]|uniref:(2Fe-2S)-binding protein n=1 Tax=Curvibacter soli TaxID=3031331 RepID=UPI0023DC270B|nr:(2Fe-2S)-binding protein [Ramlibacter sp. H39-3-26]MDF1485064.1 (2Fe-2S)-binding protein [Ramlibacter sp. H39-3-26]